MKRLSLLILMAALLVGCAGERSYETVNDDDWIPEMPEPRSMVVSLPEDAAAPVSTAEDVGRIYIGEGYTVSLQVLSAGDLDRSLRQVCGYCREDLTVMEQTQGEATRYDFVWSSLGESGDEVGRAAILDDGSYHYALAVMVDADMAGKMEPQVKAILSSFALD